MKPLAPSALLTPAGVATLHGVSASLVRSAIADGTLEAEPLHGAVGEITGWAVQLQHARAWRGRVQATTKDRRRKWHRARRKEKA